MLDLFKQLQEGKDLRVLYHRVAETLYSYTCKDGKIVCSEVPTAGETLDSLSHYFIRCRYPESCTGVVLVLELKEREADPQFTYIPTLTSMSSTREVLDTFKSFDKSGEMEFIVRPPHTPEELYALATELYQLDHSGCGIKRKLGLQPNCSAEEVLAEVSKRCQEIGCLTREVLGPDYKYNEWKKMMNDAQSIHEFLNMIESADQFDLPSTAQYYVTPMPNGKLEILSDRAKELILQAATDENIRILQIMGIAW